MPNPEFVRNTQVVFHIFGTKMLECSSDNPLKSQTWSSRTGTTLRTTLCQKCTSKDPMQKSWNQQIARTIHISLRRRFPTTGKSRTNVKPYATRESRDLTREEHLHFGRGEGVILCRSQGVTFLQGEGGVADFSEAGCDAAKAGEEFLESVGDFFLSMSCTENSCMYRSSHHSQFRQNTLTS